MSTEAKSESGREIKVKMKELKGKKIVLGVTGGIAAYKTAILVRLLVKAGAEVRVVMTPVAKKFITPLTLSALSDNPVLSNFQDESTGQWNSHVELGLWADLLVIAPLTASTLAKMVTGIADNLLVTTYLSCKAPVLVAPAMDLDMYAHPSTQRNLETLREWGTHIVDAVEGELASHLIGKGRMADPETIFKEISSLLKSRSLAPSLIAGKRLLLTMGPTYENIDPVRYIGNYSTGKMGTAIAEVAAEMGALVEVVAGPSVVYPSGKNIHLHKVTSALEMLETCQKLGEYDIAIFCAAVADYRVTQIEEKKIKRENSEELVLHLTQNPDIAKTFGGKKNKAQLHVGFGLETTYDYDEAEAKRKRKNLDMIVVNSLENKGAGFAEETNLVHIHTKERAPKTLPLLSKREVAYQILREIEAVFNSCEGAV